MASATEILVHRRVRDGWHIYTCDRLPGLYVAHQDDRIAYENIPEAIEKLFKLDTGADVSVFHKLGYETFVSLLSATAKATQTVSERTAEFMREDFSSIPFVVGSHGAHRLA